MKKSENKSDDDKQIKLNHNKHKSKRIQEVKEFKYLGKGGTLKVNTDFKM